ncbi:Signal recognition particle 14 kDa protein [Acorus gramineus]|uniref:Signal recognition particle 14 kDa protein n=1 Tax=Acorus gramineus TaxID=55184 RepID=A0AAV9B6E7_ACOGR|nr:Signal recognition particle 14 kDa protein [Acorus gramineus]
MRRWSFGFNFEKTPSIMVLLQPDPFLNELTKMFEQNKEKGSVWVTFKRSTLKCKAVRQRMQTVGELLEYRCLVRATDGKKKISTAVESMETRQILICLVYLILRCEISGQLSTKEHQKFQASYATLLKAHMDSLKKRDRKDKKK